LPPGRIAPIDRMRGLVMVLMTSDHAAHVFYRDFMMRDTAFWGRYDAPLPAVPFLHRWLSHLCAPTFVFLAGTALALSMARRRAQHALAGTDRDLLLRGALLIGLDLTLISALWGGAVGGRFMLQVLFAIGSAFLLMIPLRRLPTASLVALGLAILVGHEALVSLGRVADAGPSAATALVVSGGVAGPALVLYPVLPWLAFLLLGHGFGSRVARGADPVPVLVAGAAFGLAAWALVRAADGYGNLFMTGVHDGPLRWLQVSKYPPSIAFAGLELGLMAGVLALLFVAARRTPSGGDRGVLLVLGQTALFYYVLHVSLLEGAGALLRVWFGADAVPGGLGRTWLAVALTVAVLYPACLAFRAFKRAHPRSLVRLI